MRVLKVGSLWVLACFVSGCAMEVDALGDRENAEDVGAEQAAIYNGSVVTGAGPDSRSQGIVRILTPKSCTGFFITGNHILTAAHCFSGDGAFTIQYDAPGLAIKTVAVIVTRNPCYSPGGISCDQAVITLPWADVWATASRRFWLYGGSTIEGTWLHAYGYGATNYDGSGAGTLLRTAPGHASFAITDHTAGYFEGEAYGTRTCAGDSGGPVVVESSNAATQPIVWGTIKGAVTDEQYCTARGDTMRFTKTTTNIGFYERA